jgi:hypothetical protein
MMQVVYYIVSRVVSEGVFVVGADGVFRSKAAAESLDDKVFICGPGPKMEERGQGKRLQTANRFYESNFLQHYDEDNPEVNT